MMEKNEYETYEYLSTNNTETEPDQFFVVQNDSTFLLNRQVQYVAQVQNVKEAIDSIQGCTVYDVNPQQFFVDVAENSTELVSVADNYVLPPPESEENDNIYNNSFLLQAVSTENQGQAEKDLSMTVQFKEPEPRKEVEPVNKQSTSCTEVTLSDEQYKTLEQKGWVLLDVHEKICLLDTYGLHDITSNTDLIKTLRADSKTQSDLNDISLNDNETLLKQENTNEQNTAPKNTDEEFGISNESIKQELTQINTVCEEATEYDEGDEQAFEIVKKDNEIGKHRGHAYNHSIETVYKYPGKTKIVTKYIFKDIPDKIVLGKTANGKKLVAKVVKRWKSECDSGKVNNNQTKPDDNPSISSENKQLSEHDIQCKKLFQQALCGEIETTAKEVVAATKMIAQLSQVPDVKSSIDGRNVIFTKVIEKEIDGVKNQASSYVTGFVTSVEGCPSFVHKPDLLQKLIRESEESSNRSLLKCQQSPGDHKILQIHISECRSGDVEAISVFLNDQELPNKMVDQVPPTKQIIGRISRLHACGSCAAIFVSEAELAEHQENHTFEAEGALTIDTDKLPNDLQANDAAGKSYYKVQTNKGIMYGCHECPERFKKLTNCIRHGQVHRTIKSPKNGKCIDYSKDPPFKCTMCTSSYHHPASLSKHICRVHVTEKFNKEKKLLGPEFVSWRLNE